MKKVLCIMLSGLLVLALCACAKPVEESKDLLDTIKERGYIVVATEGNWAPYTYHDDADKLTGFDVEMARLIAAKLGVDVKFEETQWDSILAGIDAGRFDIACNGVGWAEDRAAKYEFSEPYVYMKTVLVVRSDDNSINSFEELQGKKTANTASSTYATLAEQYGATVIPVDNLADTINLLIRGDIDATVNAAASIGDYLLQHPDAAIRIAAASDDPDDIEKDCIPVAKTEEAKSLHDEINRILGELRDSGELAALSVKFFGADYTKQ